MIEEEDSAPPPSGWIPPRAFEEYRLLRLIGWGGMGEVYLAHDTLLDRLVAVKFLGGIRPDPDARDQVLKEARATARLQHPNVVSIYRVGELDGRPFIVSEFVRGSALDTIDIPVPWRRALELGIALARGLAAAHRGGVLHRDIKPGNAILAEDGQVKLLDFGLAKFMDRGGQPSRDRGSDREIAQARARPTSAPPAATAPTEPPPAAQTAQTAQTAHAAQASAKVADHPPPDAYADTFAQLLGLDWGSGSSERVAHSVTPLQGTPLYMAPELWLGQPASTRSDVYALGVVLYEITAGAPPRTGLLLGELGRAIVSGDPPPLAAAAPSANPRFTAIVDRCLRRDPAERFASGDDLREALEQLVTGAREAALPEGNPYRGLLPFDAEHRALFFGRANEIGAVVDRLRSEPAVVIAGDSGVGKSSLCAAGVLPMVSEGMLGDGRLWSVRRLVPGRRPLAALAAALADLLQLDEEDIAARLVDGLDSLARDVHRRLGHGHGRVLYVDQLEEVVTLADAGDAHLLGEALGHLAARVPGLRLLMTVRSDFLSRVAAVPGLGEALTRGLYLLRPLSSDKIWEAIVGPARAKGVGFESAALIERLVASTSGAQGLPLLQFALAELWDARADLDAPITEAALEGIGGVAGALARHADRVLLALSDAQRAAARRVLIALVTPEGTRAKRSEAELVAGDPAARAALEALVRGRLLVAYQGDDGVAYEITHEALLKGWGTLRRWLDAQQGSWAVQQRLELAAAEWNRLGRAREALWGARQLEEAAVLDPASLGPREQAFLEATRRAVRRRRRRWHAALVGVPAACLLLYGAVQVKLGREVDARVGDRLREASALAVEAQQKETDQGALRTAAFAAFDARSDEHGERLWARTLVLSREIDHLRVLAGQALEAALAADGDREDVRDRLAALLYDRALAAERDGAPARCNELLERLAVYDLHGEHARRWNAPAELTVTSAPPGAQVTLARFVADDQRRLGLADERALGATPLSALELPRGSYLLTLEAEGHTPVRYPVLLGRREKLRLDLDLPGAADVPPGFVYVPPGRFLFGSAGDETVRQTFLSAGPQHEVKTGPYLIARHETTYAEWIDFLNSLPPEERSRRAPRAGAVGFAGAVELKQLEDGVWQLLLQPTTRAYTARAGEAINYGARPRNVTQDWLRLPVTGISRQDADAFAAWLHATGRVPGARLCTEHEWERAARGADDREFPSGDHLEPDDANLDMTYGADASTRGPDQVGLHPASRSPFDLDDMVGNVFEWTTASMSGGRSVIRGGAYYYGRLTARSANRTTFEDNLRDPRLGLRVCASFPARVTASADR